MCTQVLALSVPGVGCISKISQVYGVIVDYCLYLARCKITGSGTRRRPTGRFLDPLHDHYETPMGAWKELLKAIPSLRRRKLWDPFYCKGATGAHWTSLRVPHFVCLKGDFFGQIREHDFDIVVTNPPFTTKQVVLDVLVSCGKPFIVLLRTSVLFSKWFRLLVPVFELVVSSRQVDFVGARGQKLSFGCVFVCVRCGPRGGLHACKREQPMWFPTSVIQPMKLYINRDSLELVTTPN